MTLETLEPAPGWDAGAEAEAVTTLAGLDDGYTFRIWCDDGCKDCRALLPDFGAALEAAGIPGDRVIQHAVERLPEGKKRGPRVEAYGVERIPTVVVEHDGEEVARYEEGVGEPIASYLAARV